MKKVIINADDLGISEAYNYGVIKACREGIAGSTSIMINMPAAQQAVQLVGECPGLFIGLHTNLVLGSPCSDPREIPSLVDERGLFYRSSVYRTGKRNFIYEDVKTETIAQMERFRKMTGSYPVHIEPHAVISPVIESVLFDVAQQFGIHTTPFSESAKIKYHIRGYADVVVHSNPIFNDILDHGVTVDNFLKDDLGILSAKDSEILEYHFHPGYIDQFLLDNSSLTLPRCRDLATLCEPLVKNWFDEHDVQIVDYTMLRC